jgi:hypothetical protein
LSRDASAYMRLEVRNDAAAESCIFTAAWNDKNLGYGCL